MKNKFVSIVIPMKNEEKNCSILVKSVMKTVKKNRWNAEVIIVDDASTDKTGNVLDKIAKHEKSVKVIHRSPPSGPGRALRKGFAAAKGDVIVTMDGDLSHDPSEMPRLVAMLKDADIVCGSRNVKGGKADMQKSRIIISSVYNFLFRKLIGIPVKDFTSGYRAYKSSAIKSLNLDAKMFGIYVEIPIKACIKGLKLAEIPIHYHKRLYGRTNLSYLNQGMEYLKYAIWGVKARVFGG